MTTMIQMLNRMLRYANAIVKRGVDRLIDAIENSPKSQTKNAETPWGQKHMSNDTNCVGPLAERVSTDALWRMEFGRWMRCMVIGWVPATAILLEIKRAVHDMRQKFTAVALGRELVQLQVPRRRSRKATLHCVRRKHETRGLKNRLLSESIGGFYSLLLLFGET